MISSGTMHGDERKRTADDVSKVNEMMSKPGVCPNPGISLVATLCLDQAASGMKAA